MCRRRLLLAALRRSSAAARHLVCLWTLVALLALPLFSLTFPGWHLPVLRAQSVEPTPVYQEPTPPRSSATLPKREGDEFQTRSLPVTFEAPRLPVSGGHLRSEERTKQGGGFLFLYLLGLLLASVRPLLGLWGIRGLRRGCTAVTDAPTLGVFTDCARLLGVCLPCLCRADVPVPMTWGWRRPVVVLPDTAVGWPEGRLRSVLLHELAHVKRRDWPGHRVADLTCTVYWFHPLVWVIARRLRAESEAACDDLVLASGIPAPDYARHLLSIAQTLPPVARSPHSAIAMAQTSRIERRLLMLLDTTQSRRALTRRVLLLALVPSTAALVALAVLRPDAKAQTAPAMSSPPASKLSSGRLDFTFNNATFVSNAQGKNNTIIPDPSFKINGTTLFAGITDANKPGSPWWSATGTLLPTPIYDTNAHHAENYAAPNAHTVSLAFRLPPTASDMTVRYELPQSVQSSSDGFWPTKIKENAGRTEAQMFADTNGTRIVTAEFPASLSKTNIRVGIASGAWTTSVHYLPPNPDAGSSSTSPDGTFIFSPLTQMQDGFSLTLTTDTMGAYGQKWDLRVVAVDALGHEILPTLIGDNSSGKMDQINVHFALLSAQVKDIRVETRPFQWIEFKDVALQPVQ